MHPLLVFEFIGTTELLVIAFVALIIFGPRKLPELGRSLGRSMGEFKRASEDFKRTWEYEVEMERAQEHSRVEEETRAVRNGLLEDGGELTAEVGPAEGSAQQPEFAPTAEETYNQSQKQDWL